MLSTPGTATSRRLRKVDFSAARGRITAIIGPSGCGKSTFLRALNRMNDLVPGYRTDGADHARRRRPAHAGRRRRHRPAPAHGHGVPAAQPFPDVDLRQRRLWAAPRAAHGPSGARRASRAGADPRRALGRGERPARPARRWACRVASSSGSAWRAAWRSTPRCILMDEPTLGSRPHRHARVSRS